MPLNGAGTYSAPAGTTATPDTTILSAAYNALVDDLTTVLNTARPIAYGGTGGTSVITGWDNLASKGTDIATASSINLTAATGPSLSLTGTTTVTAVTLAEGSVRFVRAAGAFQITASSSLLCDGSSSVNMSVAANDLLMFRGGASSVVSVVKLGRSPTVATSGQSLCAFFPTDNEPPSSNYATFDVRNGHPILVFPDAVVYVAIFTGVMPSKYAAGGVTVVINWMNSTTSTNKVCWSATLERVDVGTTDLDSDSFGTQVIDTTGVAANATSGIQSQTSIGLTTGANMDSVVAGDAYRLKITRETGQANDTQAGDAQLVSIEIKET